MRATRGRGLTSPSDRFRALMFRRRGWSDIAVGRRMGGPRSDGRRAAEVMDRYDGDLIIYFLFLAVSAPNMNFEKAEKVGF